MQRIDASNIPSRRFMDRERAEERIPINKWYSSSLLQICAVTQRIIRFLDSAIPPSIYLYIYIYPVIQISIDNCEYDRVVLTNICCAPYSFLHRIHD